MSPLPFCGCYYLTPPRPHVYQGPQRHYLPLLSSSFHSTILSTTSRTLLTQKFTTPSQGEAITECKYTFPLYDGVSVVSFTCRIGKTVLYGIVKEKDKAKKVFDEAVARGESAGLLQQSYEAADVFTTSLGNIPAGESVFVEIAYVGELKAAEGDGAVRFTIPTIIAPRYGNGPSDATNLFASAPVQAQDGEGISIVVDVNMPDGSFIKGVQSPSHPIAVSMGTISSASDADPIMSRASATLSLGSAALEKDFVLVIQAKDVGVPKAILETHTTIPNHRALMATLVPKFSLPPSRPEIVFVADRSGSMGENITMLKSAMKVFLKSMPAGVKFNICSFGSSYSFLWPKSQSYTAETLDEATRHVQTFAADMGGTETFSAIKATIEQRWTDLPLEIMLLTDGDVWGQNDLFTYVNQQVQRTKGNIRVFPLGIGNGVSHSLIEGLARAGNGFAQAVQDGERFDNSLVRMLRGALSPHITDYSLEVKYEQGDDDFEVIDAVTDGMKVLLSNTQDPEKSQNKPTISLFDSRIDPEKDDLKSSEDHLPTIPSPKLLQAPHKIPNLFPFSRTAVYLLMSPETIQRNPTSVIFRATCEHGPLVLEIPVEVLSSPGETIHQLAAKKATQDLEEGRGWIYDAKDQNGMLIMDRYPSRFNDLVKKEAVRIGVTFQVAGKWCSFVAVSTNEKEFAEKKAKGLIGQDLSDTEVLKDAHTDSYAIIDSYEGYRGADTRATDTRADDGTVHSPYPREIRRSSLRQLSMNVMPYLPNEEPVRYRRIQGFAERMSTRDGRGARGGLFGNSASASASAGGIFRANATPTSATGGRAERGALPKSSASAAPDHYSRAVLSSPFGTGASNNLSNSFRRPGGDLFSAAPLACAAPMSPSPLLRSAAHTAHRRTDTRAAEGIDDSNMSRVLQAMTQDLGEGRANQYSFEPEIQWSTESIVAKVHALIALQSFRGAWPSSAVGQISAILGIPVGECAREGVQSDVWITLLMVRYLEVCLSEEEGTWALIVEKARGWLAEALGMAALEGLEREATKLIGSLGH